MATLEQKFAPHYSWLIRAEILCLLAPSDSKKAPGFVIKLTINHWYGQLLTSFTNFTRITTPRMLHAWGFLSKVFDCFARYELSVDLVTTSEIVLQLP